jgi:hypothetical protein
MNDHAVVIVDGNGRITHWNGNTGIRPLASAEEPDPAEGAD